MAGLDNTIFKICDEKHKTIDRRLDDHDDRLAKMEEANIKLTTIVEVLTSPTYNKKFWESDLGKKVIIYFMLIGAGIIGAAIGVNLLERYFK